MARPYSPWLQSVTIPSADTNVNLLTLLQAIDSEVPSHVQSISIQVDIDEAAARVFIGNPDTLSETNNGAVLVATMEWSTGSHESNLIFLGDIELRADTSTTLLHVSFIVR